MYRAEHESSRRENYEKLRRVVDTATIEAHPGTKGKNLPPIYVTIANNATDFIVKISDRGGGIRHDR